MKINETGLLDNKQPRLPDHTLFLILIFALLGKDGLMNELVARTINDSRTNMKYYDIIYIQYFTNKAHLFIGFPH